MTEQEQNKQINDVLEDMWVYGRSNKKRNKRRKRKTS